MLWSEPNKQYSMLLHNKRICDWKKELAPPFNHDILRAKPKCRNKRAEAKKSALNTIAMFDSRFGAGNR